MSLTKPIEQLLIKLSRYIYVSKIYYTRGFKGFNMKYRECKFCVMDTSDPEIVFDDKGVCNHCKNAKETLQQLNDKKLKFNLNDFFAEIKQARKNAEYDCIIGLSGGVDSSYILHLACAYGLKPLAVHIDNLWDSELAVENIKNLLKILDVDLYTYVVDWQEFRDLQLSFLRASTPDIEIPTDHMIFPVLSMVAHHYHCTYVIMGHNSSSESILPRRWSHGHFDWKYIKNIHKKYGTIKLKTYPYFSQADWDYFQRKLIWFNLLDYIDYDKEEAKKLLIETYRWRDYGGKHYESFYTRFYQTYILPQKFGYDKRRMHLSSLIVANQLSRDEAKKMLEMELYDKKHLERDTEYFIEKMQITKGEFQNIMQDKPLSYWDYPNGENDFFAKIIKVVSKILRGKQSDEIY